MLGDLYMGDVMDAFEPHGQHGNGYGWDAVARQAIRSCAPAIAERVEYGSESGTFVAHSADRAALEQRGALLRAAFHDRALLDELICDADPDWFD
jgi:Immunity protein 51